MTLAEAIAHEEWAATTAHGELAVEHAQMRDWLRELEQLRTENSRLRSELESVGTAAYLYGRGDLKAENAKLRELVAEMFNACPMCVNCAHNHLTVGWYDRIRELGVKI